MDYHKLLDKIVTRYIDVLKDNLVGFYLHGSIAFGCFNPNKSDVDFIVVVKTKPTTEQKVGMLQILLDTEDECTEKGYEMSVVLEKYCTDFIYPTPFELHYGKELSQECRADIEKFCNRGQKCDPDLAAHFTVIKATGITLFGKPIKEMFGDVPVKDYLDSIWEDIQSADNAITEDPMYFILNLCRVYGYAKEGLVLSKKTGGEWGLANVDKKYEAIIKKALKAYCSDEKFYEDDKTLKEYAVFMIKAITNHLTSVKL